MNLNSNERLEWLKKQIERSQLLNITLPTSLGHYQKLVFNLLKKRSFNMAISIMHFKIIIEKNGWLKFFRKLQ